MYINPPLTAVCVFNACDDDNTQKSNYYNDDLLSCASLSCKISLTLLERGGHNDNKKKHRREREAKTQIEWLLIFFASKKPLSAALFGVLSCKKNNLVCKLSSL